MTPPETKPPSDFIRALVARDVSAGKHQGRVQTRFPPEPNGYLHIGHAKAICLNFGVAAEFGGLCNLRFDDTNPLAEDVEYVDAITEDLHWLGFDWEDRLFYASDYFERLYQHAVQLVRQGAAYVDQLSAEEIRAHRGTLTEPGRDSPWRDRPAEESLELFERMRRGELEDGAAVLRARIDMAHPNMNLRDPTIYRIRKARHHRTGEEWCIYPMYDYAHCVSDSIEGITHSLCTLEFEHHRPLYDWFLEQLGIFHSQQIEFARLNLDYTVMSKRKLRELVEEGRVDGWEDPRMPTLCGLRRRGYTPHAIRDFCDRVGIAKANTVNQVALLEACLREDLNRRAPRAMAVLRPLKLVIENWPEDRVEEIEAINNPEDPSAGTRQVPFTRELYIEREDFREDPPRKFFRLAPGREVRLRYAYYVKCEEVVKDPASGEVVELRCSYDPESRGGTTPDGRKVKGILHWVPAPLAIEAEVRLYDRLFDHPSPAQEEDWKGHLNPDSLEVLSGCKLEPHLAEAQPGGTWQFERQGYFCADSKDSRPEALVFNRTVGLRDTWAKIEKRAARGG